MHPTNQQLLALATDLAKTVARNDDDAEDLAQEGLWALHLQTRRETYYPTKPMAFARTVMLHHMYRYYSGEGSTHSGTRLGRHTTTPFDEDNYPLFAQQPEDRLELDCFFTALHKAHGELARRVAENLVQPTDRLFCELLVHYSDQKNLLACLFGITVRGSNHIRISHQPLRQALGLTNQKWYSILKKVRAFTHQWLEYDKETSPDYTSVGSSTAVAG